MTNHLLLLIDEVMRKQFTSKKLIKKAKELSQNVKLFINALINTV